MAVARSCCARAFPPFECRPEPDFSSIPPPGSGRRWSTTLPAGRSLSGTGGLSSLILRFPPNFVRQLSTKARRNCSNIGVAQIVAASWTDSSASSPGGVPAATAVDAAALAAVESPVDDQIIDGVTAAADAVVQDSLANDNGVELSSFNNDLGSSNFRPPFLSSDGSLAIHAGEFLL